MRTEMNYSPSIHYTHRDLAKREFRMHLPSISDETANFTRVGRHSFQDCSYHFSPKWNHGNHCATAPRVVSQSPVRTHAPSHAKESTGSKILTRIIVTLGFILIITALCIGSLLAFQRIKATQSNSFFPVLDALTSNGSTVTLPTVNWSYWAQENPDIVAWIVIPGTSISLPVAYAPQKEEGYYLTHDASGAPNIYGCPYITNRCTEGIESRNTLILGHNMSDGTMFSELLSYRDIDFLTTHRSIYILTPDETQEYVVSTIHFADSPLSVEQTICKTITLVTCSHYDDSSERLLVTAQIA